jgi:hypothetical protein
VPGRGRIDKAYKDQASTTGRGRGSDEGPQAKTYRLQIAASASCEGDGVESGAVRGGWVQTGGVVAAEEVSCCGCSGRGLGVIDKGMPIVHYIQ